ncbi:hypothetical protein VA7868_03080 [Vibrio aerogenes CECT 7868]|uniref:Outer membrane protein beta-barrel domain-containing protein n=1 Tax=Vibrio aerogenes CECT 7868 TaxID=1216006 RepID=A0A1M5ZQH3_9VIBR|nr:outer membrane beta-barrel protein [Vibrio aerogenes]SHI26605.1 hypothetical protein VA7868_03080 [Vibrio aerogenes CECT 7868]
MVKKIITAALLTAAPLMASAASSGHLVAGADYLNIQIGDGDGQTISMNVAALTVGYPMYYGKVFRLTPEVRFGQGIGSDEYNAAGTSMDFEVSSFSSFALRTEMDLTNQFYIFATPAISYLDLKGSVNYGSGTFEASADGSDFTFGAGLGFKLTDRISTEVRYEAFDEETDVYNIGLRMNF